MAREVFEKEWQAAVTDPNARAVILGVLVNHSLLEETQGMFSITNEGRAFLTFLDENNAWHQPAIAPSERYAFYPPMTPSDT